MATLLLPTLPKEKLSFVCSDWLLERGQGSVALAAHRQGVGQEVEDQEERQLWKQLTRAASDLYEDTSEFFEDTLRATLQRSEHQPSRNETDLVERLGSAGADSTAALQEALSAMSETLSAFAEKAASLAVPPADVQEMLVTALRSIIAVEQNVTAVVSEALATTGESSVMPAEVKAAVPQGPYGLAVHDALARRGPDASWVVPVQAWIYRRNEQRHRIRMALARKLLLEMIHGANISEEGLKRYEDRGRLIFRTLAFRGGERNVVLSIKFDGEEVWRELPATEGNGRCEVDISVPEEVAARHSADGRLGFTVRIPLSRCAENVTARGAAHLCEPEGVMVISDIDDTVKVTEVFLGNNMVVRNTFLEEFRPVPGMAELYKSWAQDYRADFAFVSNSPPELQEPLREFLVSSRFPSAALYLRPLAGSNEERRSFKQRTISELLRQYPRRKVILVGDSGERDPLICADLLRRNPSQVIKVLIRQVSPTSGVDQAVFAGIPEHRWQVFSDASEATLPDELRDLGSVPGILKYAASLGSAALRGAAAKEEQNA
eukprot:TRINITY_DN22754_c0_g4_i1.p1 TRINITY_DN22754_c0_g4~~TRINITY_DN22754_c0_g4_i1.p1  ORF type:complete len:599 (-),score=106.71 TRINITY_DN22754_c0_g4_i1:9-1655(-)